MPATPPNLRLIGGEMLVWSDEGAGGPPPACGRPLELLAVAACRTAGRVLVAGPHRPELVGCLAVLPGSLTCLLRSYADGAAMAARYPAARVLCGSLAKLGPDEQFDAIVALDGLSRLASADGPELGWGETLETLLGVLRPGGRLVLALDNPLGLHRLVELPRPAQPPEAAAPAWSPPADHDPTRPPSLVQFERRLRTAGLEVRESFLGYAQPSAPSILIRRGGTAESEAAVGGFLDATVAAAAGEAFAGVPVLSDPRRLATAALRGGAATELAPVWVVVADRPDARPPAALGLAEVLVADAGADAARRRGWSVAYALDTGPDGWWRRLVGSPEPRVRAAGPVRRDPARLAGRLPAGRCLAELLLAGTARGDLPAVRGLLADYASWLATHCDATELLPGELCFATPANTVVTADRGFAVLDRSWALAEPMPLDVALLRGLRHVAVTVLEGGCPHPWPVGVDADSLAVILVGMAGRPADRLALAQAVDLEVDITAAIRGLDERRRADLAGRLAEVSGGTPPVEVDGHRELHRNVAWLRAELVHVRAKLDWYDELLTSRERSLERAHHRIRVLSGSLSYRVGWALLMPFRLVRRDVVRVLKFLRRRRRRGRA